MTENTATPQTKSSPPLLKKSRLINQTSSGPSLFEAASQVLRKALKTKYPDQDIDPDQAMIASPVWRSQGETLMTDSTRFESVTQALVRQGFTKSKANYIEGEHFLTLTPHASEPVHLAVSMDTITVLLNEQAPLLFVTFEQRQLDYWNEPDGDLPRWRTFSDTLKTALDVQSVSGWDEAQCSLGRFISQHPDKHLRPTTAPRLSAIRACLLDIDLVEGGTPAHLMLAGALVLTAMLGSRELIVMYTIEYGYESFASMADLGASLPERVDMALTGLSLKWRLYEPEGNIFDAMVWALVGQQLDAIDALDPSSRLSAARISPRQETESPASARDSAGVQQLEAAIPDWLKAGSIDDIQAYSRYITELGSLRGEPDSDVFDVDDILLIQPYAQEQMRDAIVAEKEAEGAATLPLDEVRITITHSFEAGGFTLPNPHDRSVLTLGEFALQNTRPYEATVAYVNGAQVPTWMSAEFLLRMSNKVNIGENYPKKIKSTLIDDPVQARRHKDRYAHQLPLLLPLLALECKLKREGGVDEQGYAYIGQLMDCIKKKSPSITWPVTLRPLAFRPLHRLSSASDTVANTYIIGPREGHPGPCLLYRPLLDQPLTQFPSAQNMLYAFYQPGELRDWVLAWLPTSTLSFEYAQYVFSTGIPSPWTISQLAFEPFIHLDLTASVDLENIPLTGDVLSTLFTGNSQAMAELADRQSTSNAERRWALLADSGWAMFSVAANFLSGSAGTAAWVWQSITQIQTALDAHERGDTLVEWSSTGDVLLALGIILTHHVAARRSLLSKSAAKKPSLKSPQVDDAQPTPPTSSAIAVITQDTIPLPAELPTGHLTTLKPGTLGRPDAAQFLRQIEHFEVTAPDLTDHPGPLANHLYELDGKQYAQVGIRWFQVSAEADEPIVLVDPHEPSRSGFEVKYHDSDGKWHWDLKLRLRGGGPTGRMAAMRQAKTKLKEDAWAALHRFIEQEFARNKVMDDALNALSLNDVSTTDAEKAAATTTYLVKANELGNAYTEALAHLEQWREAGGGGVFYQSQLMRFTVEQHRYVGSWLRLKLGEYSKTTHPLVTALDNNTPTPRNEQIEIAKKAIALSDAMIEQLKHLHHSLNRLTANSGITRKVADKLKRLLPVFTRRELEANEIGMSNELCVRERPGRDIAEVRSLVATIIGDGADACHALIELKDPAPPSEIPARHIEQLTALVDRFGETERRLQDLSVAWPDDLEQTRFERVRTLFETFDELARERLLHLLPAPEGSAATPKAEPGPSTSRAVAKVTKTRPRVAEVDKTPSVEKKDPIEEVPFVKVTSSKPVKAAVLDDIEIISNAISLNTESSSFITRTRTDAQRPKRIPADMKDLFDQQVVRLEQAASDVDAATARRSAAGGNEPWPIATLSEELRSAAAITRRAGNTVYGAMLMARKPREAYLKWLEQQGQVEITDDVRGRIRTKQRQDFFQEYRILDKTHDNKLLWVAHFHYDKLTDPPERFTAAHLKFADAYLQELETGKRQQLNTFDAVDNALRRIIDPVVRDLFLKPETRTKPQT